METVFGIIVGLIILTIIVALHEFGHAIVARRNGVIVEEFGIGFPPRAKVWKMKKSLLGKNVEYTLNWLPLGGFVKLQGEHDDDTKPGDYGRATFWQKTKILLAGVVANWLTAVVLLTILAPFGIPKVLDNQFHVANDTVVTNSLPTLNYVGTGSPAETAGLRVGDELVRVAGRPLDSAGDLATLTQENKGKTIEIIYNRNGVENTTSASLRSENSDGKGYLGAGDYQRSTYHSTWSAPIVGVGLTWQLTQATYQGLGDTVANLTRGLYHKLDGSSTQANQELTAAGSNVTGPVGLIGVILPGLVKAGLDYVVLISAVIAVSLAAINVLPIPALDGGRWFLTAIYRLRKKPLTADAEEKINGYGFMALIGLIILITIVDVTRFF